MKILLIVTNSGLSGAPVHVKDLAVFLLSKGITIEVIVGSEGYIEVFLNKMGIKTEVISTLESNINPINDLITFTKLKNLIKTFNPDLIHAHSTKSGYLSRIIGLLYNIPVIYTVHGWGFGKGRKFYISIFVFLVEFILAGSTKQFITVSNADKKVGKKVLLIPDSKIVTIYNGSNFIISDISARPVSSNIIMVARNSFPKDYITFFRSLKFVDFNSAIVVGEGTDSFSFIEMAKHYSGANFLKIKFLGVREDVEKLIEDSSIFVLSSKYEGLPISIIEAMSKGLPIIASSVGGVSELVNHGINGFTFKTGDFENLAKFLNILSTDIETRLKFGSESLKRFKKEFMIEEFLSRTYSIYLNHFENKF